MAIEQLQAGEISVAAAPSEESEPLTWAAKWDMWWMRVWVAGFILMTLDEFFNLERTVRASSWELKITVAIPLLMGADTFYKVWKAGREKRIDKRLSEQVLTSIFFIVAFTYIGMVGLLRHFVR